MNYYNENDPFAAAWLRNLISAGHISEGIVDERSIADVHPQELEAFHQCHFFAGIGVWSYALRQAGWPDDKKVWTGSCPCQSFSAAGQRKGFDDARHLWPTWFKLIRVAHPQHIFGEQVASKDALAWLDLVHADLEGADYAVGAVDTCAAGFGAPHIRQRFYWVADSMRGGTGYASRQSVGAQAAIDEGDRSISGERLRLGVEGASVSVEHTPLEQMGIPGRTRESRSADDGLADSPIPRRTPPGEHGSGPSSLPARLAECGGNGGLEESRCSKWPGRSVSGPTESNEADGSGASNVAGGSSDSDLMGDSHQTGSQGRCISGNGSGKLSVGTPSVAGGMALSNGRHSGNGNLQRSAEHGFLAPDTGIGGMGITDSARPLSGNGSSPTNGHGYPTLSASFWSDTEWLPCIDGKARPVEPGTFPLAHGASARVGRLRGYGNALVAPQAAEFIRAFLDVTNV